MTNSNFAIEEAFLENLRAEKALIAIYLVSGIKLHGYIEGYDDSVVFLRDHLRQIVYKSAISTIGLPCTMASLNDKSQEHHSHKNRKSGRRIKEEA